MAATDTAASPRSDPVLSSTGIRTERDPRPCVPSTFVFKIVFPMLEGGSAARKDVKLGLALRHYIKGFSDPIIYFDALLDRTLLMRTLSGFGRLGEADVEFETVLVTHPDVLERIETYFAANSEARRRYHVSVDAEALRWAFMRAGGVPIARVRDRLRPGALGSCDDRHAKASLR
jgi:hypothetical protein